MSNINVKYSNDFTDLYHHTFVTIYDMLDEIYTKTSTGYGVASLNKKDVEATIVNDGNMWTIHYPQSIPPAYSMSFDGFANNKQVSELIDTIAVKYCEKIVEFIIQKSGKVEEQECGKGKIFIVTNYGYVKEQPVRRKVVPYR